MSYTITQQATTPNAAYTRLLYVVSGSTNTNKPLFQYVMDVYESGSNELIKRTTQTINPAGVAVFDPSRIMQGQLSDDYSWEISSVTPFDSSSKTFRLEFGEQFASSISSSAAVIDNIERTNTEVFRGVVEPNDGYFNWPSSSYAVLSNMPATMSMQSDDFGTIGVYNNDVSYVSQSFYSASGDYVEVQEKNYTITDNFSSIPISSSTPYWNYAEVNVSSSLGLQSYRYEVSDETHREKVRFAFINKLGTWDYFNNYNPVRQAFQVKREQYTSPRVDYSSLTSVYNIERRGLNDYHNSIDDEFVTDTDLLDKTNANWIEELIESPSVYIQRNGEFIPIVITDSSYVANQNQARQKQFKYTITFKPSNQPFGKWEPEFVACPKPLSLPPVVVTNAITFIQSGSLTFNGNVLSSDEPVTQRGFAYNTSINPVIADNNVSVGSGIGSFSTTVNGLNEDVTYFVRAYASSSVGLVYGNNESATTVNIDPPTMATSIYTDTLTNSSTFRAYSNITSNGGSPLISQGIVYSTSSTPNISSSDSIVISSSNANTNTLLVAYPVSGSTTYNVRAWGTNYGGIGYSSTVQVTTPADFNPKAGGLSNPYLHYDFTRPKFVDNGDYDRSTLADNGRKTINSLSASLYDNLGPLVKSAGNKPPALQTPISGSESAIITTAPYGYFNADSLNVAANDADVIFWQSGSGVNNNITSYTIATYYQPDFGASNDGSAIISWDGRDTGTVTSPNVNSSVMINRADQNSQTVYGGTTSKTNDTKLIGNSIGGYYSYSGSGFTGGDDTRPWMSQYVYFDKSSQPIDVTIQRGDGGPVGSGSYAQPGRVPAGGSDNAMLFGVGAEAYTDVGTANFKIAHLVVYSGSLSSDQMGQLNASFTSSRPDITQYFNLF